MNRQGERGGEGGTSRPLFFTSQDYCCLFRFCCLLLSCMEGSHRGAGGGSKWRGGGGEGELPRQVQEQLVYLSW